MIPAKDQEKTAPAKPKPVKNTFQSVWLIDNQTVMVPVKGTLEMDIMHRFGVIEKGYEDLYGLFASSNIRLGLSYVPIDKLNVGFGVTRTSAAVSAGRSPSSVTGPVWDGSLKYSIITQTKGVYPVSVTYYANAAYNTKKDPDKGQLQVLFGSVILFPSIDYCQETHQQAFGSGGPQPFTSKPW